MGVPVHGLESGFVQIADLDFSQFQKIGGVLRDHAGDSVNEHGCHEVGVVEASPDESVGCGQFAESDGYGFGFLAKHERRTREDFDVSQSIRHRQTQTVDVDGSSGHNQVFPQHLAAESQVKLSRPRLHQQVACSFVMVS